MRFGNGAQGMGDFWVDLNFGEKLPKNPWGGSHFPECDRFLQGPIAQHCEEWARKLEAWPKLKADERKRLYKALVLLPDRVKEAVANTHYHNLEWSYHNLEEVRTFWLTPHAQRLLTVAAPHIADPRFFADDLCKIFDTEAPLHMSRYTDMDEARKFFGIEDAGDWSRSIWDSSVQGVDWLHMGRVARTEALYHGLLELLPDRMAEAGAHFRAVADGAEADGAEAATPSPPAPERLKAGKCRWLLKPSRGYA